jgi:hypothetical protein
MKQTGHSGDKKASYGVLAACLEERTEAFDFNIF